MMALRWQPLIPFPYKYNHSHGNGNGNGQMAVTVKALGRREMDMLAQRMAVTGEAWRDAFDRLFFEAKKTVERIDRRYAVSHRLSSVATSAAHRAREFDTHFHIRLRFRSFQFHFSRNWPMYRMQLNKFLNSPLGRSFTSIFFIWFALSGWLFRLLIFATWLLPFAGPLLIATLANTLVIKGTCPACKMKFAGYKNQIIRCTSCGNIVWQPKADFFSRGGKSKSNSKSDPEIIDVDFEEK